jgi:hypothetical protein
MLLGSVELPIGHDGAEHDSRGMPQLTITLPGEASLDATAGTLVKLLDSPGDAKGEE